MASGTERWWLKKVCISYRWCLENRRVKEVFEKWSDSVNLPEEGKKSVRESWEKGDISLIINYEDRLIIQNYVQEI
jgi:hypothetical protein